MTRDEGEAASRRQISRAEAEYAEFLATVPTAARRGDPARAAEASHRMDVVLGLVPADDMEETHG